MEIIYCDTCGMRIPTDEVMRGVATDGSVRCAKCRGPAAASDRPPVRRGSSTTTLAAQRRTPLPTTTAASAPAPTSMMAAPRATNYDRPGAAARERQNSNSGMLIGGGIAFGCVSLLGLFFMFSGGSSTRSTLPAQGTFASAQIQSKPEAAPIPSAPAAPIAPVTATTPLPIQTLPAPELRRTEAPASSAPPKPAPAFEENARREAEHAATQAKPDGTVAKPEATRPVTAPGVLPSTKKADPEELAQQEFDVVKAAIAKADAPTQIKRLEEFVKTTDANTFAASRARAMLSSLKKDEARKSEPVPAPPAIALNPAAPAATAAPMPNAAPGAPTSSGDTAFKVDFEGEVGVNFSKVVGDLPGGRPGKALKLGCQGGSPDGRGGIYNFSYPQTSAVWKKGYLTRYKEGQKIRFKYYTDNSKLDLVVAYNVGTNPELKLVRRLVSEPKQNAWTDFEISLSELKEIDGGNKMPDGASILRVEFWAYGLVDRGCYLDDVEIAD